MKKGRVLLYCFAFCVLAGLYVVIIPRVYVYHNVLSDLNRYSEVLEKQVVFNQKAFNAFNEKISSYGVPMKSKISVLEGNPMNFSIEVYSNEAPVVEQFFRDLIGAEGRVFYFVRIGKVNCPSSFQSSSSLKEELS